MTRSREAPLPTGVPKSSYVYDWLAMVRCDVTSLGKLIDKIPDSEERLTATLGPQVNIAPDAINFVMRIDPQKAPNGHREVNCRDFRSALEDYVFRTVSSRLMATTTPEELEKEARKRPDRKKSGPKPKGKAA